MNRRMSVGCLVILSLFALVQCQGVRYATCYYDDLSKTYFVKDGIDKSGVAYGSFDDSLEKTGWGVLKVQTNSAFDDLTQMYAGGYLEGALTAHRIYDNYQNIYNYFFKDSPPSSELLQFLQDQTNWVNSNTAGDLNKLAPLWQQIAFIQAQFNGLYQGYNDNSAQDKQLDLFAFQTLNGVGDFLDLIPALHKEKRPKWESMNPRQVSLQVGLNGHCSALIKLNGDLSELWAAHSSWFTFSATNRIFKHYNFDLSASFVAAKKVSFSSYPGFLESLDDFYMMSSGLTMVQTTNGIFNQSLYDLVQPQSLFAWQRVRAACSMAHDGEEWSEIIAQYNSGTYNNQYMVVDYNKFQVGQQILPGILWVSEQIPGLVQYADVTDQLERGYWASYNVPYFPEIYERSGYPEFVKKHGVQYSYQMAPRAQIFRRDQGTVVDLDSFKAIMRYNNYKNDPYAKGDPGNQICSRFDLEPDNPVPSGCYDTKVTSSELQAKMISHAINGPTRSHNLPAFSWSNFNSSSHQGLPEVYDFDFVIMDPKW